VNRHVDMAVHKKDSLVLHFRQWLKRWLSLAPQYPHSKLEEVLAVVLEEAMDDAVELARVGGDAKLERRGLS